MKENGLTKEKLVVLLTEALRNVKCFCEYKGGRRELNLDSNKYIDFFSNLNEFQYIYDEIFDNIEDYFNENLSHAYSYEIINLLNNKIETKKILKYRYEKSMGGDEVSIEIANDFILEKTFIGEVGSCLHVVESNDTNLKLIIDAIPEQIIFNVYQKASLLNLTEVSPIIVEKFEEIDPYIFIWNDGYEDFVINKSVRNNEYMLSDTSRLEIITYSSTEMKKYFDSDKKVIEFIEDKEIRNIWYSYLLFNSLNGKVKEFKIYDIDFTDERIPFLYFDYNDAVGKFLKTLIQETI